MKIAIDAGHGGKDPGALGNGLLEKDLTLAIAKRAGAILAAEWGAEIVYTRTDDRYLELAERSDIANNAKADYFVSVHINAGGGTGFESFAYVEPSAKSVALQDAVHRKVVAVFADAGLPDRGQKRANFSVLRRSKMPAILLECGFIDTAADAAKLKDAAFIEKIARAIAEGVADAAGLKRVQSVDADDKVKVVVNGKPVKDGLLIGDITYVPVRAVAESLGASVVWDGKSRTVTITKK